MNAPTATPVDTTEQHMNLFLLVHKWAEDRNFKEGATLFGQACKLAEEYGEFMANYNRKRDLTDDIGDCMVVVTVLRYMLDIRNRYPARTVAPASGYANTNVCTAHEAVSRIMALIMNWGANTPNVLQSELYRVELCLTAICEELGYSMYDCLLHAYNEIKDRKGRMVDGKFVKEADEQRNQLVRALNAVPKLREDCSTLCAAGEPCMATDSGVCDCDRADTVEG